MTGIPGPGCPEVVTFGEAMGALRASTPVRLGGTLSLSVAGAESNVAIGLARLGHTVRWAGRVGDDEFGALVLRTLRAEAVDIGHTSVDRNGRPTGLLVAERRIRDLAGVTYWRAGSAGSAIRPEDILPAIEPGTHGSPDGMTTDTEGHLWVAVWGAGRIQRYDPNGALATVLHLPTPQPTSVCLHPTEGRVMVTTARYGLSHPHGPAGAVLSVEVAATAPAAQPCIRSF